MLPSVITVLSPKRLACTVSVYEKKSGPWSATASVLRECSLPGSGAVQLLFYLTCAFLKRASRRKSEMIELQAALAMPY